MNIKCATKSSYRVSSTSVLQSLHWLHVYQRIRYKLSLIGLDNSDTLYRFNKVITTVAIRPLDDWHILCSICLHSFGAFAKAV